MANPKRRRLKDRLSVSYLSVQTKHSVLRMAVSIAIGLGLAVVLIFAFADRPMTSLKLFFTAPIQNWSNFSLWIQKTVPLIFTGVAVCIMFSANQFNLGLEGAFLFGGFIGGALTNIYLVPGKPLLGCILGCLVGGLVGAFITFIPAILDRLFGASVMVTSLMMNYICLWYSTYLLFSVFKDPKTSKSTYSWTSSGKEIMVQKFKLGNGDKLTIFFSFFLALVVVYLAWLLLYRTKFGFKLRSVGQNASFSKYVGISVASVAIIAQVIGGFIGGVGGACEIMSVYTNYRWVELTGFGWDGVTMAVFAKNNPKNVPIAALFISYLRAGAYLMSIETGIQNDLTKIVEGVIILFLLAERFLQRTYRKMIIAEAEKNRVQAAPKTEMEAGK